MNNNKLTDEQVHETIAALSIVPTSKVNGVNFGDIAAALTELQERRKADNAEPFGFVTKRCAEHMHDDDRDENNWMWSISAVVIGCNPKLKHEVPVYLHPASSGKEGA